MDKRKVKRQTSRQVKNEDSENSEGDSDSDGDESASSKRSRRSKWTDYQPKRNHRFSKIDNDVLQELEVEDAAERGIAKPLRHSKERPEDDDHHIRGSFFVIESEIQRVGAERPDKGECKLFNSNHAKSYSMLRSTVPRVEFGLHALPPPFTPSFLDNAARKNHGQNLSNPLLYTTTMFCASPYILASRSLTDRGLESPWEKYPLSAKDVGYWMSGDPEIGNLIPKFNSMIGPVDGVLLREFTSDHRIMGLFTTSGAERAYREKLIHSIEEMVDHEMELLSPFMEKVASIVKSRVLVAFPGSLGPKGEDEHKTQAAALVNKQLNAFLVALERAMYRRNYRPLVQWAKDGSFVTKMELLEMLWLTGGSSRSSREMMPFVKQRCYDLCLE